PPPFPRNRSPKARPSAGLSSSPGPSMPMSGWWWRRGPDKFVNMGSGSAVGWPFWAGTSDERVDEALRLAGLRPGERLLDLGCGDGRVLLRAAEAYGATVIGVELDSGLAATARQRLAAAGVDGTVLEADF